MDEIWYEHDNCKKYKVVGEIIPAQNEGLDYPNWRTHFDLHRVETETGREVMFSENSKLLKRIQNYCNEFVLYRD